MRPNPLRFLACLGIPLPGGRSLALASILLLAPALIASLASTARAGSVDDAREAALKAIDSLLVLEPNLPRPDVAPIAVAPGPIDLRRALEIGIANNVNMRAAREQIQRTAYTYVAAQRGYLPQWRATASFRMREVGITQYRELDNLYYNEYGSQQYTDSSQTVGLTQKLPFGGNVALDVGGGYNRTGVDQARYAPRASLSINQPLLRGAGREAQQQPLVVARQNLLYALRNYKFQLEDYCIGLINDFLYLQNQRLKAGQLKEKNFAFECLIKRSQMLYDQGRESELDVLRATQESLLVQQELLNIKVDIDNRTAQLAVSLNMADIPIPEFPHHEIPFVKLHIESGEAVALAMQARPDLLTLADSIEDSRRALRLAKRNLLPELGLNLSANAVNSDMRAQSGNTLTEEYAAGLTLSLPLERTREHGDLFAAWLSLMQDERSLEQARYSIGAAIRHSINRIKGFENAVEIQNLVIESSTKGVAIAEFRFDRGQASNRSVIEAETTRNYAINTRNDILLNHYIASLRLRRDMGQLNAREPLSILENHY